MQRKRIFIFIFIIILLAVSLVSFLRIQNLSPLQERSQASTPEAIALANNEYAFINQLYLKYIGSKTAEQINQTYQPMYEEYARHTDFASFYRGICSLGTVNAIAKQGQLNSDDPFSAYFRNKYNSSEVLGVLDFEKKKGGWHVRSAVGFDCLIAANAMRNVLGDKKNIIMSDLTTFTRGIESSLIQESQNQGFGNTILDFYKGDAARNVGDSQAEEALAVASLFEAASTFLPSTGAGAITTDERTRWHNTARDLAKWAVTKDCKNCSIQSGSWLINNHNLSPNPNYTLSLLTAYSELAMASNQTNKSLPSDIFDDTVKQSLHNIGNDLSNYLSPTFGFKGDFKIIDNNGNELTTFKFDDTRYTLNTQIVSSSLPLEGVDSMNQYVIPNTTTLKSYIFKGDKMWAYICNNNNDGCKADYQTTIAAWLGGIQRKANNTDGWNNQPLPTSIDSVNQWFKDDTTLLTYIYSGNSVWHFICTNVGRAGTTCTAEYVKSLSSHWPAALWTDNRNSVDAVSEYVQQGTNNIKGYIYKDNKIWAYNCDRNNYPSSCTAFFNQTLPEFWTGITNSLGSSWNPPQDKIDSFHQYYNQSGALVSVVTKGATVWIYTCTTTCSSTAVISLNDYLKSIEYKWKWPQFAQNNIPQFIGVSDWGHDGTFQNSAFSTLYLINSQNFNKYNQLQQEEIRRGRNTSTLPFPSEYSNNQFTYDPLTTTRNAGGIYAMMDGYDNPQSPERKVNSHWWFNMLAGKNHSMAYLALTDKKILGSFDEQPVSVTQLPTNIPTITTAITATLVPNAPTPTLEPQISGVTGAVTSTPTITTFPNNSPTPTFTASPTVTPTMTVKPQATLTLTATPTLTKTPTPTITLTHTPIPTQTPLPTNTPQPTHTPLPTLLAQNQQGNNLPESSTEISQPSELVVNNQPPGITPWFMILVPVGLIAIGLLF